MICMYGWYCKHYPDFPEWFDEDVRYALRYPRGRLWAVPA